MCYLSLVIVAREGEGEMRNLLNDFDVGIFGCVTLVYMYASAGSAGASNRRDFEPSTRDVWVTRDSTSKEKKKERERFDMVNRSGDVSPQLGSTGREHGMSMLKNGCRYTSVSR